MKHTIWNMLAVIAAILIGYFAFTYQPSPEMPAGGTQGKLDIAAVCQGALAYMTFSSGAEAEAFVQECMAGNRPEVIDRYLRESGLDGAAI